MIRKLAFLSIVLISSAAVADSLEEQKAHKKQQAELDDEISSMNRACDTKMAVTVDWASWGGNIDAGGPKRTAIICYKPIWDVTNMCRDKDAKAAIQKEITAVECRGGAGDQATVKLAGTSLVYTGAVTQKKPADVKGYLMKTLK